MKIIDLYNMVSKGEQPKKFKYKGREYAYSVDDKEFRSLNKEYKYGDVPEYSYLSEEIDLSNLNDEIEIVENKTKKIEKIKDKYCLQISKVELAQKLNEIIDYINKGE